MAKQKPEDDHQNENESIEAASPGQSDAKEPSPAIGPAQPNTDDLLIGQSGSGKSDIAMGGTQASQGGFHSQHWLVQNGLDASAVVLAITDTGTQFNLDSVVLLTLKVQPARIAADFKTTGKTTVSRLAVPRTGDTIKIKYNPANPTQFIVL
jgi:hypothetical protein